MYNVNMERQLRCAKLLQCTNRLPMTLAGLSGEGYGQWVAIDVTEMANQVWPRPWRGSVGDVALELLEWAWRYGHVWRYVQWDKDFPTTSFYPSKSVVNLYAGIMKVWGKLVKDVSIPCLHMFQLWGVNPPQRYCRCLLPMALGLS